MTDLRLTNSSRPNALQSEKSRFVVWLLVATGAVAALVGIVGYSVWSHYSWRYSEVDHSVDSIQASSSEIIYQNPRSGVTLKLPGAWHAVKTSDISKPDPAHRFCILSSQDLTLMFWPLYPDFLPSLDADASALRAQFTSGGFAPKGQRELEVRGRRAKELQFGTQSAELDMNLVVIRRWPVIYLLAITGSPKSQTAWKQIEDALPESVDIQ